MNSFAFLLATLLSLSCALGTDHLRFPKEYYLPENWPRYTIRLSEEGQFRDIFTAGIKPYYFPGMEHSFVEFRHATVSIINSSGEALPEFVTEKAEVRPLSSGRLYELLLVSQPLTISDAESMIASWLPIMQKNQEQLDEFLNAVKSDPAGYSNPNFGAAPQGFAGSWREPSGVRYNVWFRQNYSPDVPLRLCLRINYRLAMSKREFNDTVSTKGQIMPPYGYKITEPQFTFGPDGNHEVMSAKGITNTIEQKSVEISYMLEKRLDEANQNQKLEDNSLKEQKILSPNREKKKPFPYAILGFALVLVACIVGFIVRIFKNNR